MLVALTLGDQPYKGKNGEIRMSQLAFVNEVW